MTTRLRRTASLKPDFEPMIVENLRTAGVQNTYADQRLKFDRLDLWSGQWIHAEGRVHPIMDGEQRRVAVSIGPEHGTVGPEQVLGAGREALRGRRVRPACRARLRLRRARQRRGQGFRRYLRCRRRIRGCRRRADARQACECCWPG